jgi:hypothetical protein
MNDNTEKLTKALERLAINKTHIMKSYSIISEIQYLIKKLEEEQVRLVHAVTMEYDERQVFFVTRMNEFTREKNNFNQEHNNVLTTLSQSSSCPIKSIPSHVP